MMWTKERIKEIAQTKKFAVVVASVVSLASGGASGYILAKKSLEEKYAKLSEKEIEDAKVFYQQKNKVGDFSDPEVLAQKYADEAAIEEELEETASILDRVFEAEEAEMQSEVETLAKKLKYHTSAVESNPTPKEEAEVKISVRNNIFDGHEPVEEDDEFDLEAEKLKRNLSKPYIISHDEFFEGEKDYNQNSLTFFDGDGVLADEQDQPIREIHKVVGEDNLRFGYGSKDKNIVYVRNDELELDFEVALSFGKYAEEVLGYIEHSDEPRRPRKFREYD